MLRVQRGVLKENSWYLLRRYNDFVALHKILQISGIDLSLPAKRIIGKLTVSTGGKQRNLFLFSIGCWFRSVFSFSRIEL